MLLNEVMSFKEAGRRIDRITKEFNRSDWEDNDYLDRKAEVSNKDILALLIGFTEARHLVDVATVKIRHYRGTILEYGEHKNTCAKIEGKDDSYPCDCGLEEALQHKMSNS